MKCTPNKALETKTFSSEYWRWQHRYLMYAVKQFGHPDLFITISPFEWTFPQPPWLQKLREETGHGPTNLSEQELFVTQKMSTAEPSQISPTQQSDRDRDDISQSNDDEDLI